jgi:hypothetical protein
MIKTKIKLIPEGFMSTDQQETDQPATSHRKYLHVAIKYLKVDSNEKSGGLGRRQ